MSEEPTSSTASIDSTTKVITISSIRAEDIEINYDRDIDLTELVMCLSKRIDSRSSINFETPDLDGDEKLSIILETIKEIIDEYNVSIHTEEKIDDLHGDDIPF